MNNEANPHSNPQASSRNRSGADSDQATAYDHALTVLIACLFVTAGASMFMVEPLLVSALMTVRGFTGIGVGTIIAAELAGSTLAAIVAMAWIKRWSWRPVAFGASLVAVTGNLACLQMPGLEGMAALRFATAFLGTGPLYVLGLTLISRSSQPARYFALGIVAQVVYAGTAMLALPQLAPDFGLTGPLVTIAGICAPGLLLAHRLPGLTVTMHPESGEVGETGEDGESGAVESTFSDDRDAAAPVWPALSALGLHAFWYLGLGALWAFVEVLGADSGLSAQGTGSALAASTLAGVIGALAASALGERWGTASLFIIAGLAQSVSTLLFAAPLSYPLYLGAALAFQFAWNFGLPYLLAFIAHADKSNTLAVLIPAAQGAGVALGPLLGGVIYDKWGSSSLALATAAIIFVATIAFAGLSRAVATRLG